MERWKPLNYKYFEHFSISNTGRLKNTNTDEIRKTRVQPKTQLVFCDISVYDKKENKIRKTIYIHLEVAKAFIPLPNDADTVDYKATHKEGVSKLNNLVRHIRWATQSELGKEIMSKATNEQRNRIGKFNTEKWKGYKKKKYVKIADRPDYIKPIKTAKKTISNKKTKLQIELEKEKEVLVKRIELINELLKS